MVKIHLYLFIAVFFLLTQDLLADDSNKQNATNSTNSTYSQSSTTTTTALPKVDILSSNLCKKCKCDKDVKQIDCSDGKLDGWFTENDWKTLQNGDLIFDRIVLKNNNLTKVPVLPTYPVKELYLSSNKIVTIDTGAFSNLTELTKLDLSYNKLTSKAMHPDVFKGIYSASDWQPLGKLNSLNLGSNELHNLNQDLFEHTPKLEELVLCKNIFNVIDHVTEIALSSLTFLKVLDLSYMELSSLPENILHGPRDLEMLILTGNLFKKISKSFEKAINLKSLVLDENPLTDLSGENAFPIILSLNYLSISYMPDLIGMGSGAFSNLQNLTTLVAVENPVASYIHALAFARNTSNPHIFDYPQIKKLYLRNNNISVLPHDLLLRWDKVDTLDLRYNPWNCDCSNNYLVNTLIQQINKATPLLAKQLECAAPISLKSVSLLKLNTDKSLVCTSNPTGQSSLVWIGLIIGILIGVPIALASFAIYRRGCFGLLHRNNSGGSRALYNRTSFDEDFHI